MTQSPTISIITIVYKDPEGLKRTIESVRAQTYKNIEYIVIDGASGVETETILKNNDKIITTWVSEPDKGIYDAMNKGIARATGQWVNFMNAGDIFYDDTVLEEIFTKTDYDDKALLYGYKFEDGEPVYPLPLWFLQMGIIMACHQSMFFNKNILKQDLLYDLRYPIYGDYELVNRIYKHHPTYIHYIPTPIAIYEGGGISSRPSPQKRKDKFKIIYRHYGLVQTLKVFCAKFLKIIPEKY